MRDGEIAPSSSLMRDRFNLHGKVALVTGGARGLGRAYGLALAELGADVAIADLRLDGSREFGEGLTAETVMDEIAALGRRSAGFEADLAEPGEADRVVEKVVEELGRLDILVNNAGGALAPAETSWPTQFSAGDLDLIIAANLRSTIACCQAAARIMQTQYSGCIVNTSSMLSLDPGKRKGKLAHYGMIKSAVNQYTRFLAAELGAYHVRVNCISPGSIATARILAQAEQRKIGTADDLLEIPLGRLGTAQDCAGAVCFLASELASYITGQCLSVCGGRVLTPS